MSSRLPNAREHTTTGHTVVRSGKSKRKPFNSNVADYLLIIATFGLRGDTLQLPFNDPNLDKEATTNGPEAKNEGQDIRKER